MGAGVAKTASLGALGMPVGWIRSDKLSANRSACSIQSPSSVLAIKTLSKRRSGSHHGSEVTLDDITSVFKSFVMVFRPLIIRVDSQIAGLSRAKIGDRFVM
jgi:hypothetical protein